MAVDFLKSGRRRSGTAATKAYGLASGTSRLAVGATDGTPTRAFVSDATGNGIAEYDDTGTPAREKCLGPRPPGRGLHPRPGDR